MLKKKKQAFTLMEMIITLSIMIIVLGITTSMFIRATKVFSDSNVKSTLQMEGQAIQEKMRNIGMQAISIESCKSKTKDIKDKQLDSAEFKPNLVDINGEHLLSEEWIDVSELGIKVPSKDSEYDASTGDVSNLHTILINHNKDTNSRVTNRLDIDSGTPISTHVKSLRIRPANIKDPMATIGQADSIEFNIELALSNGGSSVTYPINFTITFRNKSN